MSRAILEFAIGADAADLLSGAFGGADLRVPATCDGECFARIARVIGETAAAKLVRIAAGDLLYVPRNHQQQNRERNGEIARMLAEGKTPAEIAHSYRYVGRVTERHVYRILSRLRGPDGGQNGGGSTPGTP
jgi:DNA-binding NarL/FixJ family response regulator